MPTSRLKKLNRLLPLVAIGTIADCQSILDSSNRILTKAGLSIINQQAHHLPGLTALLEQTGYLEKISGGYKMNSQDIAFTLSPILNSSGRITHAQISIALLLCAN